MQLRLKLVLLLVALPLCLAAKAQGSSFDCSKATTKIEKMICSDTELSKLDEELAEAYNEALRKVAYPTDLKREQKEWLKERNLCTDIECIGNRYRQRLASLKSGFVTIYPPDISEFKLDCSNPKTNGEKNICGFADTVLDQEHFSTRNNELLSILQWAVMRSKDRQKALEAHRKWQKEVRDVCTDRVSLATAYRERRKELLAMWDRPGACYVLKPLLSKEGYPQPLDDDGNVPPIEPVCQALEENLNQFCDRPPIRHGLPIAPRFKELFTFPAWVQLDPEANMALIEEFIRAPWENAKDKDASNRIWGNERQRIEATLKAKCLTFSKADVDVYNLGKAQPAYRLDYSTCKQENLNLDKNVEWIARAQIQHTPPIVKELFKKYSPVLRSTGGDTFIFCGKTYVFSNPEGASFYIRSYESEIYPEGIKTNLNENFLGIIKNNPETQEENK